MEDFGKKYEELKLENERLRRRVAVHERTAKLEREIEERRKAEATLETERGLLRALIDNMPDEIYVKDTESRFVLANKTLVAHFGAEREDDLMGRSDGDFYPSQDAARFRKDEEELFKTGKSIIDREEDAIGNDGQRVWFRTTKVTLLDKDGRAIGLIGIGRNITREKETESALTRERNILRIMIDNLPDHLYVKDREHRFTTCNRAVVETDGFSPIGMADADIYPREKAEVFYAEEERVMQTGEPMVNKDEYAFYENGDLKQCCLVSKFPLRDGEGNISGIVGVNHDITEIKRAEQTLQAERNVLRTLIDNLPAHIYVKDVKQELKSAYEKNQGLMDHANDAIFIADAETGMLLDANKKTLDITGRTLSEIQAMHESDLHPRDEEEKYRAYFKKHVEAGTGLQEETIVDLRGNPLPVIVSATILDLGGRRCMMGIFHDISDIKKAHDALQLANKKLNLLAEITRHDIRNKLTMLSGYLELFTDHPPEPQHSMYLAKLKSAVKMIDANIEFTKLYQDLGVVAPVWQNVDETFFKACTHVDIKQIRFLSEAVDLEIFADPLLERVFYNIIANAVEHGSQVSVVRLSATERPDCLVISLEDDGIGIAPHDKETIFRKGYGKNTGLGLFLSREILSITNITIKETGEFQHGARFEMCVPKGIYRFLKKQPQVDESTEK